MSFLTSLMPQMREWRVPVLQLLSASLVIAFLFPCAQATAATKTSGKKQPLPEVSVSVPRGFRDAPFSLMLTTSVDKAVIRYTLDGAEPTLTNGSDYSVPLKITNTTLLRVAAFKERTRVSTIATHSYIFLDQVLHQQNEPPGFPVGPRAWNGQPAGYQMDQRIVNDPTYRERMRDSLRSLPAVSIVCPREDMFGTRGLYLNTTQRGEGWERACSAEMILPDSSTAFQIDCGLRIQGAMNRIPNRSPKHSFRLVFKEQYGATKLHYQMFPDSPLKKFDTLVLRADYNNSWVHWDPAARPRAQRTRDAWMKDSHRAMGWVAAHNRYVHLFLNGLYWGVYDFTERPDANFAAAYLGGTSEDYDVVNEFEAKDGTLDAFNALNSLRGFARDESYQKLQRLLDMTNYIDYLLLNYYAGNQDWGENKNWYTIRRRAPTGLFQYFMWDGEQVLHGMQDNTVIDPYEMPFRMAEELKQNAEFRLAFADRVQKHFFNDGALTPAACIARWMKRANEVDSAMIAESARWGYYRRNPPFTHDKDWATEQQRLVKTYFPQRTATVLEQLRAVGLYPRISAPSLKLENSSGPGVRATMSSSNGGTIYYTTNGLDPRVAFTGLAAPHALNYSTAVTIPGSTAVKARVLKNGAWSALVEFNATNSPAKP